MPVHSSHYGHVTPAVVHVIGRLGSEYSWWNSSKTRYNATTTTTNNNMLTWSMLLYFVFLVQKPGQSPNMSHCRGYWTPHPACNRKWQVVQLSSLRVLPLPTCKENFCSDPLHSMPHRLVPCSSSTADHWSKCTICRGKGSNEGGTIRKWITS